MPELRPDDIGDIFVCLVHCNYFLNNGYPLNISKIAIDTYHNHTDAELIGVIAELMEKGKFNMLTTVLIMLSVRFTQDPFKCFEIAYNDIKDRRGKMISGSFVKESDLIAQGLWH